MRTIVFKFALAVGIAFLLAHCGYAAEFSWPKQGSDPKALWKIIDERYAKASTNSLGTAGDIAAIKQAIAADAQPQIVEVREIRWLSPSVIMAFTRTQSAAYYYVSEQKNGKWGIVTHYQIWVS